MFTENPLRKKRFRRLESLAVLLAFLLLMIFPKKSSQAAAEAVELCLRAVIPSLFPFFVLSELLRLPEKSLRPVMRKLFKVNGACANVFLTGLISGYPVGGRAAVQLYKQSRCSRDEAERMLIFCNNSGPAFIFGFVGAVVFQNACIAILLYSVHIAVSIAVGVLFGLGKAASNNDELYAVKLPSFTAAMSSAFTSSLNISAYVIFFAVYISMIPFESSLVYGMIELSSGLNSLSVDTLTAKACALAEFMLSWGGISVYCQLMSFVGETDLSMRRYFVGRLLHGVLSASIIYIICRYIW